MEVETVSLCKTLSGPYHHQKGNSGKQGGLSGWTASSSEKGIHTV